MNGRSRTIAISLAAALLTVALTPPAALAVKVGDITHLQGCRTNRLLGMGFVVGLKGTGDGGKYLPTMRLLAQGYKNFGVPVLTLDELKDAKNVAVVEVEATLPRDGAREGERLDVQVSSVGAAKSLAGGRLWLTPLVGPNPDDTRGIMALAGGPLEIEDPQMPTVARVAQGATLEQDWIHSYVALGRDLAIYRSGSAAYSLQWIRPNDLYITLVIDEPHAEWAMASTIAQSINEEASIPEVTTGNTVDQVAMAFDPRTVVVRLPEAERANPAPFLARIESIQLFMPFTEARVTVHRKSGAIVITGDAEISPVGLSYNGLTITAVVPQPAPTPDKPRVVTQEFVALDPQNKGGAKLRDLVEALDQLKVPAADKITIIEQLHKTGKLHATLIVEQ